MSNLIPYGREGHEHQLNYKLANRLSTYGYFQEITYVYKQPSQLQLILETEQDFSADG